MRWLRCIHQGVNAYLVHQVLHTSTVQIDYVIRVLVCTATICCLVLVVLDDELGDTNVDTIGEYLLVWSHLMVLLRLVPDVAIRLSAIVQARVTNNMP